LPDTIQIWPSFGRISGQIQKPPGNFATLKIRIWPDTKNPIRKAAPKLRQSCAKAAHDMRSRTQRVTPRHAVCAARYPRYVRVTLRDTARVTCCVLAPCACVLRVHDGYAVA